MNLMLWTKEEEKDFKINIDYFLEEARTSHITISMKKKETQEIFYLK